MGTRYFNTFIYLFTLTIVVGAFAAIAMNEYGVKLIAVGCFGLSVIILLRLYAISHVTDPLLTKTRLIQEYILMGVILLLFGLRALRIRFDFVELIFVLCSVLMIINYALHYAKIKAHLKSSKSLSRGLLLLYGSIIMFFTAMSLTFLYYQVSVIIGAISFILASGFIFLHFKEGKDIVFRESETSLFKEVFNYLNLSPLIFTMIMMMSIYMGLHQINVLPSLYTGDLPARYEELLKDNDGVNDIGTESIPKHETYWNEYQSFLESMEQRKENATDED